MSTPKTFSLSYSGVRVQIPISKVLSDTELSTETAKFVVAGSDTTATIAATLTNYLTGSLRCYRRAYEGVRAVFAPQEIRLGPQFTSCHFLRACIDEAFRLSPYGASVPWREVDRGSATSDSDLFPAACGVGTTVYAIHHDARYWEEPWSYMPERWLQQPTAADPHRLKKATMMLTLAIPLHGFDFRRADQAESWEMEDAEMIEYELENYITASGKGMALCSHFPASHLICMPK
ncbi:MAG: hypothetical protein M1821_009027 [Bathelium mastoideum]|nr:MAG: hypothetical protein M1821_009027 [Bathelium mastoideum]